jgi:hypothetical protein
VQYVVEPSKYNPRAAVGVFPIGVTVCPFDVNPPMEVKVHVAIVGCPGAEHVGWLESPKSVGQ